MKLRAYTIAAAMGILAFVAATSGFAWEKEEHRLLADSAVAAVMGQRTATAEAAGFTIGGASFGERVAHHAADDFDKRRFHERGQSILNQLRGLASTSFDEHTDTRTGNVIAAFLLEHIRALKIAARNDAVPDTILAQALDQEAIAQGYLTDAFAAGHILSYHEGLLTFLARRNRIEAHDYHRDRGVYVINARGDLWQTFGDGLMCWYPPTYQAVFEACETSLRELLTVWYHSHNTALPDSLAGWLASAAPGMTTETVVRLWLAEHTGPEYFTNVRLPSLLLLPMPVAASWSFRTDLKSDHGERLRHHYPQLQESGLHDPDLRDIDAKYLYPRETVTDWMVPEPLRAASPTAAYDLVTSDPDWASVRYSQERTAPPSYKGVLLQLGGQVTVRQGQGRLGGSIGLGYGLWDDLMLIKNVSAGAALMPSFHEPDDRLLTGSVGLGFDLPGETWPKALHLEGGVAVGLGEAFDDFGPLFAIGLDSRVMPLGFTYAGVTWRLKYQWFSLDTPVSGPSLELILQ